MGYVDYFLIVWDFISFARSQGIVVGPGRGSGAGSIVTYCMYIRSIRCVTALLFRAIPQSGTRLHAGYRCGFLL